MERDSLKLERMCFAVGKIRYRASGRDQEMPVVRGRPFLPSMVTLRRVFPAKVGIRSVRAANCGHFLTDVVAQWAISGCNESGTRQAR